MSQDLRRRIAARERLDPAPRREDDVPAPLQIRRFSQGLERAVLNHLRTPKLGRFSRGAERLPEDHPSKRRIGRYSDGLDHQPADAPERLHVGRFSQGIDHSDV
jgi:hypothetical protein